MGEEFQATDRPRNAACALTPASHGESGRDSHIPVPQVLPRFLMIARSPRAVPSPPRAAGPVTVPWYLALFNHRV